MKRPYGAPAITVLGSLTDITRQQFNKIGQSTDAYSTEQNNLVGSVVPIP